MTPQRRRRHFLCDMENIHSRWGNLLPLLSPGDAVTIFISSVSGKPDLSVLAAPECLDVAFYFNKCDTGRPNAMDFQIMCELGRLSVLSPDTDYVVVSGDHGYLSAVHYMAERGASVSCLDPTADNVAALQTPGHVPEPEYPQEPPAEAFGTPHQDISPVHTIYRERLRAAGVTDADLPVMAGILWGAMAEPQNTRKLSVLNRLVKRYGTTDGRLRYTAIKDLVHDIADKGPWPPPQPVKKPDPDPTAVNSALGRAGIPLSKGDVGKICTAIRNARKKTKHKRNDLEKRLRGIVRMDRAQAAARALEPFLDPSPAQNP